MAITVTTGLSKKVGLPNYSSIGVSLDLTMELDQLTLVDDPAGAVARIRGLFALCQTAVDEELSRQQGQAPTVASASAQQPRATTPTAASEPLPPRHASPSSSNGIGHANANGNGQTDRAPRTGRALFAWTKDQEQRHDVALLKYLNSWSKLQGWDYRMTEWNAEQVQLAHAEAVRKLASAD